jgi:hypothetical protein
MWYFWGKISGAWWFMWNYPCYIIHVKFDYSDMWNLGCLMVPRIKLWFVCERGQGRPGTFLINYCTFWDDPPVLLVLMVCWNIILIKSSIYLLIYVSIYLSIYRSIYLSIYLIFIFYVYRYIYLYLILSDLILCYFIWFGLI